MDSLNEPKTMISRKKEIVKLQNYIIALKISNATLKGENAALKAEIALVKGENKQLGVFVNGLSNNVNAPEAASNILDATEIQADINAAETVEVKEKEVENSVSLQSHSEKLPDQ